MDVAKASSTQQPASAEALGVSKLQPQFSQPSFSKKREKNQRGKTHSRTKSNFAGNPIKKGDVSKSTNTFQPNPSTSFTKHPVFRIIKADAEDGKTETVKTVVNFDTVSIKHVVQSLHQPDASLKEKLDNWNNVINDVIVIKKSIVEKTKTGNKDSVFDYIKKVFFDNDKVLTINNPQNYFEGNQLQYKREMTYREVVDMNSKQFDLLFSYVVKHSWDVNFWFAMLPKFEIRLTELEDCLTVETVNNLIAVYTEINRCKIAEFPTDIKRSDEIWSMTDQFCKAIPEKFTYDAERGLFRINNEINTIVRLFVGDCETYAGVHVNDVRIHMPLVFTITNKHGELIEVNPHNCFDPPSALMLLFKLFEEDRFAYEFVMKICLHNFINDTVVNELKLKRKTMFSDPDTDIDFINKICYSIVTRSGIKSNDQLDKKLQAVMSKFSMLFNVVDKIYPENYLIDNYQDILKESPSYAENDIRFIVNKQIDPRVTVAMNVLQELYYGDLIRVLPIVSNTTYNAVDQVVNKMIKFLTTRKDFIVVCEEIKELLLWYVEKDFYEIHNSHGYVNLAILKEILSAGEKDAIGELKLWHKKMKNKLHQKVLKMFESFEIV